MGGFLRQRRSGTVGNVDAYTRTRRSLHGVAECVLSGPQYVASGTIRLRVLQGGFGTVTDALVRVAGTELVVPDGGRVPLQGRLSDIAARAGLTAVVPDLYGDHAGVGPADDVEEVNLGVSPGDEHHSGPYAYVGPWDADDLLRADGHPFWNAPFGATLDEPAAVDAEAIARFFRAGMVRVRQARQSRTTDRDA